jgi:hypothetical protein
MATKYSIGDDGMFVENVGPWAKQKHKILPIMFRRLDLLAGST